MSSQRDYREFDLDSVLSKVRRNTVNLHDFEMYDDRISRVVLSFTGKPSPMELCAQIASLYDHKATPIRNSFRKLTDYSVVGYVASRPDNREYDEARDRSKYRSITTASNMLMDKSDESTWELKESTSGTKYLCRTSLEDMAELSSAKQSRRGGIPVLANVATPEIASREFIAFVNAGDLDMDYGFVVGSTEKGDKVVLSALTLEEISVPSDLVVHAVNLMGSDEKAWNMTFAGDIGNKSELVEYYRKAYGYAPDYVQDVIDTINDQAAA